MAVGYRHDHRIGSKTHRAVIVDEGWRTGSLAEVSARIVECVLDLDAPIARVCSAEVPMPYANTSNRPHCRSRTRSSPR